MAVGMIDPSFRMPTPKPPVKPQANTRITTDAAHQAGIKQQAGDYDAIMKAYKDTLGRATSPTNPLRNEASFLRNQYTTDLSKPAASYNDVTPSLSYTDITPERVSYKQTQDVTDSMAGLKDLAETGGYSAQGIQELRARGISPIRAVYSNMNREMKRRQAVQGGYMPGMAAALTRMGREASEMAAQQTSNINADIAEKVASGRRQMAPVYSDAAGRESGRFYDADTRNQDAANRAAEINAANRLDVGKTNQSTLAGNADRRLGVDTLNQRQREGAQSGLLNILQQGYASERDALAAIDGMRSLYGTTPALAALYGGQMADERNFNLDVARERNRATEVQQQRKDSTMTPRGTQIWSNYLR